MRMSISAVGLAAVLIPANLFAADEIKLSGVEQPPEGLAAAVAGAIEGKGMQVSKTDGPICSIWLAKTLPGKPGFKSSLSVKYPFTAGQLVGAMQVHAADFTDFRGQPVKAGMYTLRYGQQPQDGNHVGTSELSDFLLAVPAASDADPAVVKVPTLFKRSAKATGSNHPAIFSLLQPDAKPPALKLEHDAAKEFWILHLAGTADGKDTVAPLKLVILGKSEG